MFFLVGDVLDCPGSASDELEKRRYIGQVLDKPVPIESLVDIPHCCEIHVGVEILEERGQRAEKTTFSRFALWVRRKGRDGDRENIRHHVMVERLKCIPLQLGQCSAKAPSIHAREVRGLPIEGST